MSPAPPVGGADAEAVAVIAGGRSSEHEVSRVSGASVAEGLRTAGYRVVEVVIDREGRWTCGGEPVRLEPASGLLGADVVFPALHGPFGEDGSIQGVLEMLDVPYVGSGVLASALCMDKLTFKRVLAQAGMAQVEFVEVGETGWVERVLELGRPVWVKPSRMGSSVGIKPVRDVTATSPGRRLSEELERAISEAGAHDPRVIIEAPSSGMEVECSVLGDPQIDLPAEIREQAGRYELDRLVVSPAGRIVIGSQWYDYEAKYSEGGMQLEVPADLPDATAEEIRRLSARAFAHLGCHGLARCDFFVEPDGRVLLSEINTMPGFTPTSVYAKLMEAAGLPYHEVCRGLVERALRRHGERAELLF